MRRFFFLDVAAFGRAVRECGQLAQQVLYPSLHHFDAPRLLNRDLVQVVNDTLQVCISRFQVDESRFVVGVDGICLRLGCVQFVGLSFVFIEHPAKGTKYE